MRIGIIKEGKVPVDARVPFTPEQCRLIEVRYPQVKLLVQRSEVRAFNDDEYAEAGIELVDNLKDASIIFGVKEVNVEDLLPDKTYFFFSHTIKKQPYNRELLKEIMNLNIKLVDYECLRDQSGDRILGFGKYAGLVGCYNGLLAYGNRSGRYNLKAAHLCKDREEMESYLSKVDLPKNFKIVATGRGRVGSGVVSIFDKMGLTAVSPNDFLNNTFNEAVYTQIDVEEYLQKKDGSTFDKSELYQHPNRYESNFIPFGKVADMLIAGHFWDARGPKIIPKKFMASDDFKIRTIADISCDIDGPIPSTIRSSVIEDPIYHVNRLSLKEEKECKADNITVMAVDNLPCELPKDSSIDFGNELIAKVLPNLLRRDNNAMIEKGTIAQSGELMPDFAYLQDYVDGKE